MFRMHLTMDWPIERVMKYGPQITAAMHKLAARFPKDVAVQPLVEEVLKGNKQLWLILDDERDDAFVSFVLTEIKTNGFTGHKTVVATDLAGEGGVDVCPLVHDIEKWAADVVKADEVVLVGRVGWRKALSKEGYEPSVMTYRKPLEAA